MNYLETYTDNLPDFPAHMSPIGTFTYLRTYSRYLPEMGRREVWKETVKRASEYNVGLAEKHMVKMGIPVDRDELKKEAELLFNNQYNLKQALSGRTLWVGGTDTGVGEKYPLANFNCSFTNIGDQFKRLHNFNDLAEIFYLLMVGTGAGFKVTPKMAANLPAVRADFEVEFDEYERLPKWMRNENTQTITEKVAYNPEMRRYEFVYEDEDAELLGVTQTSEDTAIIAVGDSKEAWVDSLKHFFELIVNPDYDYVKKIRFNFNSVRPSGEKLKTFGGHASGPEPLKEMFELFYKVIQNTLDDSLEALERTEEGRVKLRPIHIADMANAVGYNVVVGGVRRTAEIYLFSGDPGQEDWESLFMKFGINGIWGDDHFDFVQQVEDEAKKLGIPVPPFFEALKVKYYSVKDEDGNEVFRTTIPEEAQRVAYELGQEDYFPFAFNDSRTYLGHRSMSNNSMAFHTRKKPSKAMLDFIFLVMRKEAEPGFINLYEAARRRLKHMGVTKPKLIEEHAYMLGLNPCAEIILYSKGVCNLTTVNVMAFVHGGRLDIVGLLEAQRLSARAGFRMTLATLELPEWDKVQQRDKLTGTSLTGWKDAMGALGYSAEQEEQLLEVLGKTAREEVDAYSKRMLTNTSTLVTTVKPEGTLSIVFGAVSSGLHVSHAPDYLRRIRINAKDPLAKAVQELEGWNVYAEVRTLDIIDEEELKKPYAIEAARTLVIDFPVHSGATKTKAETLVDEQFDTYFMFQRAYTEHNTSNTIHLQDHEWGRAAERVYEGWDDFVGVSFIALDGGSYTLAPYQTVTKEEVDNLWNQMAPFDFEALKRHDKPAEDDMSLEGMEACEGGVCPVR